MAEKLTDRELQILQMLANGNTTESIATTIFISRNTVESHRRNILKKMKVKNTIEAAVYAIRNNLIK